MKDCIRLHISEEIVLYGYVGGNLYAAPYPEHSGIGEFTIPNDELIGATKHNTHPFRTEHAKSLERNVAGVDHANCRFAPFAGGALLIKLQVGYPNIRAVAQEQYRALIIKPATAPGFRPHNIDRSVGYMNIAARIPRSWPDL
jgi:hypothetical protein